jgi:hypothetical protein
MVIGDGAQPDHLRAGQPDPEIPYDVALAARPDAIVATGRSDFPNQVNNVLGFPFIFRGALDVRATTINDEMKLAATRALASLAKEDVPDSVLRAYGVERTWSSAASTSSPRPSIRACSSGRPPRWRRPPWKPAWRGKAGRSRPVSRGTGEAAWARRTKSCAP